MRFLEELKRRNVIRMAGLYLVGAWLIVQVAGTVLPMFGAPAWLPRSIVLLLAIGFLPALALAWAFELTPEGIRRDADVPPAASLAPQAAQRMNRLIFVVLILAVAYFCVDKFVLAPRRDAALVASATQSATAASEAAAAQGLAADVKSIAVLPFENLSDAKDNEYFVSGMQDMILTSLYKLRDLKVISRTSTEKYASRPENLRQVATELGVAYILEGSVQRQGDQVLISLQLIDARSDTHVWAEVFDRKVEDVFSVEKEVAGLVADALRTTLLPAASAALGAAPTANPAAYDLYLRGQYEYRRYGMEADAAGEALRQAAAHFESAIALDPGFALAYARLASTQALRYWEGRLDKSNREALAESALRAVNKARQLAPDLAEADLAMAEYQYRIELDYPKALALYDAVLARQPRNQEALTYRAFTLRRLGRYDDAIASLGAAMELDPRDGFPCTERGLTNFFAGHLGQAEADFRRAISLNPQDQQATSRLSQLLLFRDGDIEAALKVLGNDDTTNVDRRVELLVKQRKHDEALALLDRVEAAGAADEEAQELRAIVLAYAGREREARAVIQPKMAGLRAAVAALPVNSGSGQGARYALARAEAILGNRDAALEIVGQALAKLPLENDPANGAINLGNAAAAYASLGRLDLALPLLARIRALPGTDIRTSAATLRLDRNFEPVRADPRFQQEIALFAAKQQAEWK